MNRNQNISPSFPESETIRYQYSNHLGSACLELDSSAAIISYEEYHPFGTTSYRSGRNEVDVSLKRYKYVGKERDEETGLYYYGARYYAGWLCRWTSTDPLKEKYLSLSPYNYCANNPVKYVDLDGREIWIIGDEAAVKQAFQQLNRGTSLKLKLNEDGKVIVDSKARGKRAKALKAMIECSDISIEITATYSNRTNNGEGGYFTGDAFMGNEYYDFEVPINNEKGGIPQSPERIRGVTAFQTVNPEHMFIMDDHFDRRTGTTMLHAVAGGQVAFEREYSLLPSYMDKDTYNFVHHIASEIFPQAGEVVQRNVFAQTQYYLPAFGEKGEKIIHTSPIIN